MDKPNLNFPEKQTAWGTWEELLLACAVHRYGTENWNSVAMEVQKRSTRLQPLTPRSCQQKYRDLERRFAQNDAVSLKDNESISWLDELKKLRVAELKRELQRYDLSIVSLQLKVKRLTEEREQNEDEETEKSDHVRTGEEEREVIDNESENLTGNPESGGESNRENRSVNESNSTDPKAEDNEKEPEAEPARLVSDEHVGEDVKPAGEGSSNGSCGSAAKESARKSERVDSPELVESVSESKDGVEVESSTSLPRKEEVKNEGPEGTDNGEEQSPAAAKLVSVESQPLIDFLKILRSHKFGSLFERLDTKETFDYRSIIRQHIDLETIRARLEESWYSGCNSSFFRDLLLLFNNAILFFNKKSSESMAAVELRQIVLKEVSRQTSNPSSSPKDQSFVSPQPPVQIVKLESSDSLLLKPSILASIIACRKRSSITAKQAVPSSLSDNKGEQKEQKTASTDKNSFPDAKLQHDVSSRVTKKRTRERSASDTRSSGKNGKTLGTSKTKKNLEVDTNAEDHSTEAEEENNGENSEGKAEKERKSKANFNTKKQSAAKFLSRMKRSSPSESLLETPKSEKANQKEKNESGKVDTKKEQITRKRSGRKGGKEKESPAKGLVGRPVTRAAALLTPTPAPPVRGKRRRESVETEGSSLGRRRKRSRK